MKIIPTQFEFVSYRFEPKQKKAFFDYRIKFENREPLCFTETIVLPRAPKLEGVPAEVISNLLESVHLMLGISYFKLYFPPKIKLNNLLSEEQADFWNTIYREGMGEYLYQNKLDPAGVPTFPFDAKKRSASFSLKKGNKSLVAVSGGKDSIVATELLKAKGEKITAFVVETEKGSIITDNVVSQLGLGQLKIKRFLDKKIFEKYPDSFNGHIPVSMVFAFLGTLAAVLYNYDNFIVANEFSSNFGNIEYKGLQVNHQWSKSGRAEALFQNYIRDFVTPSVVYFSALRPFYEIRIVEMFSHYKKYFKYFSSCNQSFLVNNTRSQAFWCGHCAKCAFLFLLLSAFLSKREVVKIFGKNLFDDEAMLPTFRDLLGFGELKPFDCVGTFEESQAALYLARKKFKNDLAVKTFLPKIINPKESLSKVMQANSAPNIPADYKFLWAKNALILGYAREGKITHQYLRKNFSNLKIGIGDQKFNKNYLDKQKYFDLAIKTAGMPANLVTIPYTTATNLFFSKVKAKGIKIIGVTGSKGKSTTTSLVYAILKEAGLNVSLLGNIGIPMLGAAMKPIPKDRIFVLELSSYMLSDIWFSPNIAVVVNLFPEHMDYHGGENEYYLAKKNILKFQNNEDYFVYNQHNAQLVDWAQESRAKALPFASEIPMKDSEIPLLGAHNRENIKAAIAVAKIFNVSDRIIAAAIAKFEPLRHRLQPVGEFKGIAFYDDAISTTPQSTIAAIESMPKKIGTIFLGGQDRGYEFGELEKVVKKYDIKNVVLFPESGKRIFKSKEGLNILETDDMEKAVRFAYDVTEQGSICLLSCASPSYSIWKDFEEKGDLFQEYVKKLGNANATN